MAMHVMEYMPTTCVNGALNSPVSRYELLVGDVLQIIIGTPCPCKASQGTYACLAVPAGHGARALARTTRIAVSTCYVARALSVRSGSGGAWRPRQSSAGLRLLSHEVGIAPPPPSTLWLHLPPLVSLAGTAVIREQTVARAR